MKKLLIILLLFPSLLFAQTKIRVNQVDTTSPTGIATQAKITTLLTKAQIVAAYSPIAGSSSIVTVGTLASGSIPYSLLTGTPTIPTAANPTNLITYSANNGSATTFDRSDATHAADSTVLRSVANSLSLSAAQTKFNLYAPLAGTNTFTGVNTIQTTTSPQFNINYDGTHSAAFTTSSSGALSITTTTSTISLPTALIGGTGSNIFAAGTTNAATQSVAQLQIKGSTANFIRNSFYGSTSTTLTAGANYSGTLFASAPITSVASSTANAWVTNVSINPMAITNGGVTPTNGASLAIWGAATGATNNYALYIDAGLSLINGSLVGTGTISTTTTTGTSNFFANTTNVLSSSASTAGLLFGSASNIQDRAHFAGSSSTVATANTSIANLIVASSPMTVATSGTHPYDVSLVINKPGTITTGTGVVTNAATVYINGQLAAGATNYYNLLSYDDQAAGTTNAWFKYGVTRVSALKIDSLVSGTTGTDAVLVSHSNVVGSVSATAFAQTGKIQYNHTIFTPTTGNTITLINNQYNIVNPAGALLALTVTLPSSPANNDVVYIKFTQNVTTVTYSGGTVVDGITAPTAGGLTVLTYDSGTTSWY